MTQGLAIVLLLFVVFALSQVSGKAAAAIALIGALLIYQAYRGKEAYAID